MLNIFTQLVDVIPDTRGHPVAPPSPIGSRANSKERVVRTNGSSISLVTQVAYELTAHQALHNVSRLCIVVRCPSLLYHAITHGLCVTGYNNWLV